MGHIWHSVNNTLKSFKKINTIIDTTCALFICKKHYQWHLDRTKAGLKQYDVHHTRGKFKKDFVITYRVHVDYLGRKKYFEYFKVCQQSKVIRVMTI